MSLPTGTKHPRTGRLGMRSCHIFPILALSRLLPVFLYRTRATFGRFKSGHFLGGSAIEHNL